VNCWTGSRHCRFFLETFLPVQDDATHMSDLVRPPESLFITATKSRPWKYRFCMAAVMARYPDGLRGQPVTCVLDGKRCVPARAIR
jgi:hypothetical protein